MDGSVGNLAIGMELIHVVVLGTSSALHASLTCIFKCKKLEVSAGAEYSFTKHSRTRGLRPPRHSTTSTTLEWLNDKV